MAKTSDFEKNYQELEDIVNQLEAGNLSLDESLKLFEEGTKRFGKCRSLLDAAQTRMDVLVEQADQFLIRPFEIDEKESNDQADMVDEEE